MATTYQVSIVASSQVDQVDVIANTQVYQVTVVADILSGGGGVQSVTGDGVGGTATNVVMTFPTTGQITETANDRFVTDSQLVVINNTSGVNTGDQTFTSDDGSIEITEVGSNTNLSVVSSESTSNVLVAVRNTTGATLLKGTVVYITGATGQISTVSKAIALGDATSAQTLGLITADLNNNSNGTVTIIGLISNINTSAFSDGDQLYLSATVEGAFTNIKQYAPNHLVYVGIVEYAHPVNGKIFVKVQNGYELDELHNVSARTPSNRDSIIYNSTTDLWEQGQVNKSDVGLSNVPNVDTSTTSNITDSVDKRFATDADLVVIGNTSGVNTGDQDISGIATNASDITALENEQITQNNAIALNTAKRSYPLADENRLANTSGTNTGDQDLSPYLTIATASTTYEPIRVANQNYVTDAELVVIGNTSGTNTGDQNLSEFTTSERENNTVLFDQNYIIGNTAARTGNILFDFTDAKLGATTFLIHNNTGAYSFPVQGVIYDFDPASLTSIAGNIIFAFTITDITLGSEIVQIRLTLTEDQQIVQVSQPLKVVQITGVEVLSTAFTLVSGLYEADITNANILIDSSVEVIPENSTISIVEAAVFLPQTISVTGSVKIFAKNEPSGSIFVTLNIFKTQ